MRLRLAIVDRKNIATPSEEVYFSTYLMFMRALGRDQYLCAVATDTWEDMTLPIPTGAIWLGNAINSTVKGKPNITHDDDKNIGFPCGRQLSIMIIYEHKTNTIALRYRIKFLFAYRHNR